MPVYVVERYWPGVRTDDVDDLAWRLRAAVGDATFQGVVVYLGSVLLEADEVVQCRFEAADQGAVGRVNDAAGAGYDRILRAYVGP